MSGRDREDGKESRELDLIDLIVNLTLFLLLGHTTITALSGEDTPERDRNAPVVGVVTSSAAVGTRSPTAGQGARFLVRVGREGYVVEALGDAVLPGGAKREAVPLGFSGRHDELHLQRLLRRLKITEPGTARLHVAPEPDVPYDVVLRTVELSREDADGPLFSEIVMIR